MNVRDSLEVLEGCACLSVCVYLHMLIFIFIHIFCEIISAVIW